MSGYNLSGRHTLGLLKGRLGIFEKEQFQGNKDIDGVNSQYSILAARGGSLQQERMIRDKRKTLDRALWYSYQAAQVKKPGQDSDDILALYRDEVMLSDREMCLKVLKQREGVTGKVMMNWNFDVMDFSEIYAETNDTNFTDDGQPVEADNTININDI